MDDRGSGLLHIERPPEDLVASGGLFHGIQLWVNLPKSLKMSKPKYQDLRASQVGLATTPDAGALIRVIAGEVGGITGPGIDHADLDGACLGQPGRPGRSALANRLQRSALRTGRTRGRVGHPGPAGQLAVFGPGDEIRFGADEKQDSRTHEMEVLLLVGGAPIREQIAWMGPFVMNTKARSHAGLRGLPGGSSRKHPSARRAGWVSLRPSAPLVPLPAWPRKPGGKRPSPT